MRQHASTRLLRRPEPRIWASLDTGFFCPISLLMKQLAPKQGQILHLFAQAQLAGRSASRQELANECGYAFASAVTKHVDALVRKGLINADHSLKRNVRLTPAGWAAIGLPDPEEQTAGTPILGEIAAGKPILAEENRLGFLPGLIPQPGHVALKVRGESMIDAGIFSGDFAIIDTKTPLRNNRIGAVLVDTEATIKRVKIQANSIVLQSANPAFADRVISNNDGRNIQLLGPLVMIVRNYKS